MDHWKSDGVRGGGGLRILRDARFFFEHVRWKSSFLFPDGYFFFQCVKLSYVTNPTKNVVAAGHQPAADHILDPFEIFGSMVPWFHGFMVRWSSVTAALCSQRFA